MIPDFREDGYLPVGLHTATETEVTFRFGASTRRRRRLILRLRQWLELARLTGVHRFLIDGSFVTTKAEPHDIDAVVLLPSDFEELARCVSKVERDGTKSKPSNLDAGSVFEVPPRLRFGLVLQGIEAAVELEDMLLTRQPEEIFAAEDIRDWEWVEFFSRTREADGRRKGLVEIER
ncbi:MAG: hypothetical protein RIC55_19420 [Pirellulaceae bacterium]